MRIYEDRWLNGVKITAKLKRELKAAFQGQRVKIDTSLPAVVGTFASKQRKTP